MKLQARSMKGLQFKALELCKLLMNGFHFKYMISHGAKSITSADSSNLFVYFHSPHHVASFNTHIDAGQVGLILKMSYEKKRTNRIHFSGEVQGTSVCLRVGKLSQAGLY